jgi:hypothetical protein
MTTRVRLVVRLAVLGAAAVAGWSSVRDATTVAGVIPATSASPTEAAPPSLAVPALASSAAPAATLKGGRKVTADTPLDEREREYLRHDPETWAREQATASRPLRDEICKARLPRATADDCERIFQAFTRVTTQYLALQKRFLSGQVDQDEYQESFHRIMVEQGIDIELSMSPRQLYAYMGIPQGEDLFINVNGGLGRIEASGFRLGDEILDREVRP